MADKKVFYTEADLPLATSDIVIEQVIEHGVVIQRKVFAGTRVPPDLIEAWQAATDKSDDATREDNAPDYESMAPEELEQLVADRGLEVTGTGKNGNVVKADRVAALQAADAAA